MGIGALPFLLAMLLQLVFGLSPFASGMLTFTSAAGALFMKVTATPIIRRFGFRSVLIGNGVLSAFIMMSYALFRPTTRPLRHRAGAPVGRVLPLAAIHRARNASPMPMCPTR